MSASAKSPKTLKAPKAATVSAPPAVKPPGAYNLSRERYASLGVDTEAALTTLATLPVSIHCWQGDDVGGFEHGGQTLGGGIAVTGNYPGKARTPEELRADLEKALRRRLMFKDDPHERIDLLVQLARVLAENLNRLDDAAVAQIRLCLD